MRRQTVYTLGRSKACLVQRGVVRSTSSLTPPPAGASFRADLPDNFVKVAFGLNVNSGQDIESALPRFALPNVKPGLASVLHRYNNAVALWHTTPSDSDLALIVGCLR